MISRLIIFEREKSRDFVIFASQIFGIRGVQTNGKFGMVGDENVVEGQ